MKITIELSGKAQEFYKQLKAQFPGWDDNAVMEHLIILRIIDQAKKEKRKMEDSKI